ncbi:hypothetical protein ABIE21_002467 [Conyzicola nivalis]|uniref:Uncharacterized protein n=1 Tax=Conyzicola nivalis TaxID=1477021 RepID=A0ABV2QR43_9MICO
MKKTAGQWIADVVRAIAVVAVYLILFFFKVDAFLAATIMVVAVLAILVWPFGRRSK